MNVITRKTLIDTGAELNFQFTVENLTPSFNGIIMSEKIHFGSGEWCSYLLLSHNVNQGVNLGLKKISGGSMNVEFKVSIIVGEKTMGPVSSHHNYGECNDGYGRPRVLSKKVFFKAISPHYSFTVACKISLIDGVEIEKPLDPHSNFESNLRKVCSTDFFDLKIQVKGEVIAAHRLVLSAYSNFLRKEILKLNDSAAVLNLEDFDSEVIRTILDFIYDRDVKITDENVKEVLLAAKKFEITNLERYCGKLIFEKVTVDNALETIIFADSNNVLGLTMSTVSFIERNIAEVLKLQEKWKNFIEQHPATFQKVFEGVAEFLLINYDDNRIELGNDDHLKADSTLHNDFEKLYDSMECSDVNFEVEGKILKAHKLILSYRSKVFRAMFQHNTLESTENIVKITDINYETMSQMLKFLYCGKLMNFEDNAVNLFIVADKYDLEDLRKLSREAIKRNLNVQNITEILKFMDNFSSLSQVIEFIEGNYKAIFATTQWKDFAKTDGRILNELLVKLIENSAARATENR